MVVLVVGGRGERAGFRSVKWFIGSFFLIPIKRRECQCARKLMRQVREQES